MSQVVVSSETPGTLQFVCNGIFTHLHGPAGAYIPVASASQIHVPPCASALWCAHIYIYTHTHGQYNLRTPQLVGFAHQLQCKK